MSRFERIKTSNILQLTVAPQTPEESVVMIYDKTIDAVLENVAKRYPDCRAIMDSEHVYTYQHLNTITDEMAAGLLSLGIQEGTHVAIFSDDCADTLLYYYALWKIGGVVIPICASYKRKEVETCLASADADWLLVGRNEMGCTLPLGDRPGYRVRCIGTDEAIRDLCVLGKEKIGELQAQKKKITANSTDTILFTSGSFGSAKPVETTHFARVNMMVKQAQALYVNEKDIFCSVLPMHHCFSLTATLLAAMCAGACVCFPKDRHGKTILETIEKNRCTVLSAVPTLFSVLVRRLEENDYDISSLRIGLIGGSSYTPEFYTKITQKLNYTVIPSLGQTEATAGITVASPEDQKEIRARSIGRFFPGIEGKIMDFQTGKALPQDQIGEICIRGFSVMKGYYRRQDLTQQVIDHDGWLHTGDIGKVDANGYVYYKGRMKEIIVRGGENISPLEIENILKKNKKIAAVKVIGIADEHYIEEVCACVVSDGTLTEEEVRRDAELELARFKVPRYVVFLKSLPMTATGKVDIKMLRMMALEKISISGKANEGERNEKL